MPFNKSAQNTFGTAGYFVKLKGFSKLLIFLIF